METLVLYALCTAAAFYLGSRALITRPVWSRYPRPFAIFMDCAACTGFWYGLGVSAFGGYVLGLPLLGLPGDRPSTVALAALASVAWTPIAAAAMQLALEQLGSAVTDSDDGEG
jgi:hypothetical protein